ncbi:hypothetical protein J3A83DRAFT_4088843 [Scleroderma citrinum]
MISVIVNNLEKHWEKNDQKVFVAAVILNPMYKTRPFAQICKFIHASIYLLLVKLWKWFYPDTQPLIKLQEKMMAYLQSVGGYESMDIWV